MLSGELGQIAILLLAALAVGAATYALIDPYMSGHSQIERRIRSLVCTRAAKAARKIQVEHTSHRRKAVADTLKDIEEREKAKTRTTLRMRLQCAGLDVSTRFFWIASVATGAVCGMLMIALVPGLPPLVTAAGVFAGTAGLPHWAVTRLTSRRQKRFLDEFAKPSISSCAASSRDCRSTTALE